MLDILKRVYRNFTITVGISLGGYLSPRAGAFCEEVKKVVIWGGGLNTYDVGIEKLPYIPQYILKTLMCLGCKGCFDCFAKSHASSNPLFGFFLNHGLYAMGQQSPYEFYRKCMKYDFEEISDDVTQDVLILAAEKDHVIPYEEKLHFKMIDMMKNARSVQLRVTTVKEKSSDHCNVERVIVALSTITAWLDSLLISEKRDQEE